MSHLHVRALAPDRAQENDHLLRPQVARVTFNGTPWGVGHLRDIFLRK